MGDCIGEHCYIRRIRAGGLLRIGEEEGYSYADGGCLGS